MASKIKLSNANGKIVTIENNDSNMSDVTLNGASITKKVDTLADMRAMNELPETVWCSGYSVENDGAFGSHFFRLKGLKTTETDNSGTVIIVSVGGSDYVYELQFDGAVNVKWFGAVGDGVTDDILAIQNTIQYGFPIYFPKGVYIHSGITHIGGNITLIGNEATLQYTGVSNAFTVTTLLNTNASNLHITGIRFNNGRSCLKIIGNGTGIFSNIHIEHCIFDTSTSGMLWCEQCENANISNNTFQNAQDNGIYFSFSRNAIIANNIVKNCSGSGSITVGYSNTNVSAQNITIEGNEIFTDATAPSALIGYISGIDIVSAQNIMVSNNHISNSIDSIPGRQIKSAIIVEEHTVNDVTISGNKINNMPEEGIRVGNASNSKIGGLTISNNHIAKVRQGITIALTYNSTISFNKIENTKTWGILLSSSSGVAISSNVLIDCNMKTIYANGSCIGTYSPNTFISNNTFVDSQTGGTITSSANTPTYSVDGSAVIRLYEATVLVATINTVNLSWTQIKTEIELNTGWELALFANSGEYIPSTIRRTGIRYDASVSIWNVPSILTTPEPSGYIYTHTLSDGTVINGNVFKTNTMELPNHHSNNTVFTIASGTTSDSSPAGARKFYGTTIPTTGYHTRGDIIYSNSPTAAGFIGWICIVAGTPGTWKTFGAITA